MMLYRILGIIFVLLLAATLVAMPQRFRYRRPAWAPWVHGLAVFTVGATVLLLCIGGLVTSHNVGMAVPDWPNSFGYNMFLFPVQGWVEGVFYEHTHRLWASGVGLLTTLLALGLAWTDPRRWMRWTGLGALALVIVQGLMGGFRVTENSPSLAILHGCVAQGFFLIVAFIGLATSPWWKEGARDLLRSRVERWWTAALFGVTALVLGQLVLGASMRHAQLGLAIPDFPTAYGRLIPPLDDASIAQINRARLYAGMPDTTRAQILIHLAHRAGAMVIFLAVVFCAERIIRRTRAPRILQRGAWAWIGLVSLQIALGVATVWSDKAADIASMHLAVGALTLATGFLLGVMSWRIGKAGRAESAIAGLPAEAVPSRT